MYLIIGLGNPGKKYIKTKHNIGFNIIDKIAEEINVKVDKKQGQALVQNAFWEGQKVLLVKPQTYMNLSGQSVWEILSFYQDQIEDMLIIHDDLDLPLGQIRFKSGGGTGGHNGLKSIVQHLNSQDFNRLKIGISRPEEKMQVKDYVLTTFNKNEEQLLNETIEKSSLAVKEWLVNGIENAMNMYNKKDKKILRKISKQ